MEISEKIVGQRIVLEKPSLSFALAQERSAVIKKSRDFLLPWLGWAADANTPEDAYNFLVVCEKNWNEEKAFTFSIKLGGEFIGIITVLHIDKGSNRAEIGYWISIDHAKNGYIKEAVKLIEKEFFSKGFNKLIIHTDVLNEKSANVAKKLGYVFEGVLREQIYSPYEKRYRDQNVFSKLNKEWQNENNN